MNLATFLSAAATLSIGAPLLAVQSSLPEPLPSSRYDKLMANSPFAVATPPAVVAPPTASFAANLVVDGIVREKDNKDYVHIKVRNGDPVKDAFTLVGNEPNTEGIAVASIESAESWTDCVVTLKKGTEFGTIKYDKKGATPQISGAPAGAQRQPGAGGAGVIPQNFPAGQNASNVQKNLNRIQPILPRPGTVQPQVQPQNPAVPGAAPVPAEPRRRVRVINTKP